MAYNRRNPFEDENDDFEEIHSAELSRIQAEKRLYNERMIKSSERSRRVIEDTKHVAEKTEEELGRQEESLLRTEKNLDKIHGDIDIANRHLTSLKSVWGTIGNYFRKPPQPISTNNSAQLKQPQNTEKNFETAKKGAERPRSNVDEMFSESKDTNAILDRNLDAMMSGLTELKGHALLMGDTLDRHDDIIERVTYKATEADKKIEDSDKRIKKILR